jgi:predicted membrane channel-forming protein YqfA (hemolysin III family)
MWEEPMVNATAKAVSLVAIFGIAQLTVLFYSISHPSISDWVTFSFVISVVLYPMVFAYHDERMKACKERSTRSTESPADSN